MNLALSGNVGGFKTVGSSSASGKGGILSMSLPITPQESFCASTFRLSL